MTIAITKVDSSMFQLTNISSATLAKISDKFSFLQDGYKFQPKYRLFGVNGVKVRLVHADGSFPSGLFFDIVSFITTDLSKKVSLHDSVREHFLPLTDFIEGGIKDDIFSEFKMDGESVVLRDYQLNGVIEAFNNRHCILELSTGAGKCLGGKTKLKVKIPVGIAEKYQHLISG